MIRSRAFYSLLALVAIPVACTVTADGGPAADAEDAGKVGFPPAAPGSGAGADASKLDAARPGTGDSGPNILPDGAVAPEEDTGPPRTRLDPLYRHFDINHVLSTGQSNAVANFGTPVLTTVQPFSNLMFDVGVMTGGSCNAQGCASYQTPSALVPLVEGDMFFNYAVETASSGIANEISSLARTIYLKDEPAARQSHDVLVSLHGRSGNTYHCLRKGGCPRDLNLYVSPFDDGMRQVDDAKRLATARGESYVVRAVTAIHGESDHYGVAFPLEGTDGTPNKIQNYADGLIEWQSDYETQVKLRTGQILPIPLFISQMSGWTDRPTSAIANLQLAAHERAPGKVVIVGPGYPLPFANDCLHYSANSNRRLGEYFAKAYVKQVLGGRPWEPVRPKSVTRAANVITVKFIVPVPPLVLDTTLVTNPGDYGFRYTDSGAAPAITNVAVSGPDTVVVTLASAPSGANGRLSYAQNAPSPACPGPTNGPRGNVRDSDATPSLHGYSLYNWSVHFDVVVP